MTEQQWLTSENPIAMLRAFGTLAGVRVPAHWTGIRLSRDRQLKLFACACCRAMRDEPLNADEYDYIAHVEAAADSERVPTNPRDYPRKKLRPAVNFLQYNGATVADFWCDPARVASLAGLSFATRAALLRDTVGNPWRPVTLDPAHRTPLVLGLAQAAYEERTEAGKEQCRECSGRGWVRELEPPSGNYHESTCPACHGAGAVDTPGGTLDNDRLAILADALEDCGAGSAVCPGCVAILQPGRGGLWPCKACGAPSWENRGRIPSPLLAALREPVARWRGFWALDVVLGRE